MSWYTRIFGDASAKKIKLFDSVVEKINGLESEFEKLSDEELRGKTELFRTRIAAGEALNDLLPEAFAVVREAAKRTLAMRHFDVQLKGGMVLHQGKIAEMRTGEGKTLVATLPAYLNALKGKGVHVVTVNDYLAKRDAVWMGPIYNALGLTVGIIQNQRVSFVYRGVQTLDSSPWAGQVGLQTDEIVRVEESFVIPVSRKEAYVADITYGTNNEFGFDYLRDNMVQKIDNMVMRHGSEMHYAIIDEIDSILIDEARTPLIISAPAEEATEQYYQFAELVRRLQPTADYNVDEKLRSATLTEEGIKKMEGWLGIENLYVEGGIKTVHHIEQALKAETLFQKDCEYIVEEKSVVIIDEFTGRKMPGRRFSEGLHQAIEAKEGVPIQRESETLATITFQNLFRMYGKLSGMTGTAKTEEEELYNIYGLEVVVLPTNKPDRRHDYPDRIYKAVEGKYRAIVKKIEECRAKGQPMLIGTISVEKNESLSNYLSAQRIPHEILNAKNHEREAEIIAQAGRKGAITLATNMAGRGVDIKLGGSPIDDIEAKEVKQAGGLFVLGTERHESRRIDNQLRGRSARQGDPGETQFFVSAEDDLMRIFAGDRLKNVMTRLNVPDDMPIEQSLITKMLENAQKKVEGFHFDTRKHLLEFDDVLNRHRDVIYKKRRKILEEDGRELEKMILDLIVKEITGVVSFHTGGDRMSEWNLLEIYETMRTLLPFSDEEKRTLLTLQEEEDGENTRSRLIEGLIHKAEASLQGLFDTLRASIANPDDREPMLTALKRTLLVRAIDTLWVEHLVSMDYLRKSIGLHGYAQRDPLIEYKKEGYQLFESLLDLIQKEVVYSVFKVGIGLALVPPKAFSDRSLILSGAQKTSNGQESGEGVKENKEYTKVGRNDPCPCGSGRKYKKCHGT